jgi:PAS domain S-box-containing protein
MPAPDVVRSAGLDCLAGGGDMGALMRSIDWSGTALGPVQCWSQTLRMMVRLILSNRLQMFLWLGPELIQIYNDASRPVLGDKHPRSMGRPAAECWAEIWHIIGPMIETAFNGGPATCVEDIPLHINRKGFMEETHWTTACSPVLDDTAPGGIGGVIGTVNEITQQIVGERRVLLLRDLRARSSESKTAEEAGVIAAQTIARHPEDVPFVLLYLIAQDRQTAQLAGAAGLAFGLPESLAEADLERDSGSGDPWPLAEAFRSKTMQVVEDLASRLGNVPPGPWPDPPRAAAVCPIPSNVAHHLAGLLVLGVSSHLVFDDSYRGFFDLVASQVATTIANARAYEEERKRAETLGGARQGANLIIMKRVRDALQEELATKNSDLVQLTGHLIASRRDLQRSLEAQRASEQRWRSVFDSSAAGICLTDLDGNIVEANPVLQEMLGYTAEELRGVSVIDLTLEADRDAVRSQISDLTDGRAQRYALERRFLRKDRSVIWGQASVSVIPSTERAPRMLIKVIKDTTERKQAEAALRESEERYRTLFESIDEGFCTIELLFDENHKAVDFRYLVVNPSFAKQTGIRDAQNRRMREIAPEHEDHWFEIFGRIAVTGEPERFQNVAAQLQRWFDVYAFRIGDPEGGTVAILFNDITERIRMEHALRISEERFRRYFDLGLIGMAITSPAKGCLEVNDELCRILGYSRDELLQKAWSEMTHPDDVAADLAQFERVMNGEIDGYSIDKRWIRKDGQVIDSIMAARCMRHPDGVVDYLVSLVLDTTEGKLAQEALRKAQAELAHTGRVVAIGQLTASIAHEMNQPLAAVIANSYAGLRWLDASPPNMHEARQALARIVRDATRAEEVIAGTRRLLRGDEPRRVSLRIVEVIHEVVNLVMPEARNRQVTLRIEAAAKRSMVMADRVQLQQVILNLVMNAIDALSTVTERLRTVEIWTSAAGEEEVLVAVRDCGVGLDPASRDRVFDAFYTTKEQGTGMGMGLAVCRSIIQAHGGHIWATANEGPGETFCFTLPVLARA